MDFFKPKLLYLLFLIPLLLLLYVLKLRRKTHIVSSCLLWEQAIEDIKADTLFQRFRRNLLLPLQVLFLILAIFALARPFLHGAANTVRNSILIIDGSASMKATDVSESRFEAAKSAAIKMVDDLDSGDKMMVIESTSSPTIISGFTSDKSSLKNALRKAKPADTSADLSSAIQLASSIAKDMHRSEIFIMSDGAIKSMEHVEAPVHFIGFGKKDASNVGITAFEDVIRGTTPPEHQVFVALQNFSEIKKRSITVELYHNKDLIDVRELNLLPRERRSIVFDNVKYTEGSIKVKIDVDDDLDVDNCVYHILREPKALRILLVSSGNLFLEEAIRTASSRIQLTTESPESYTGNKNYDLIVFDSFIPNKLPSKNVIFVNPDADLPFGKLLSQRDNPNVIDWDKSNPIMRFVDFSNLQVNSIRNYDMPLWMKPLAESDKGAFIWSGEYNGQRVIVLPFELRPGLSSNFPMLPAFPIFVSNALNWLKELSDTQVKPQVKPGEPVKIHLPGVIADQVVTVKKPDGEEVKIRLESNNFAFKDTDEVGIYEVTGEGISEKFAVNLLDEAESSIRYMDRIKIAGREVVSSASRAIINREIWSGLVLVAILLLAAEWWVYHRRVLV